MRAELRQDIGVLRVEVHEDIGQVRREVERSKTSMLRWMFGFWIGTLAPLAGLVVYLTSR